MSGWSDAPSLLVTHVGARGGHAALGPALRALAAWAERRGARLVGLWDGAAPPGARLVTDRELLLGRGARVDLRGEAPWGAVVLSDPGRAAIEMGYALHLAGVPRRAGLAAEFGGAALTDPVPPPPPGAPEARHLGLLAALGLLREARCETAPSGDRRRGDETPSHGAG